MAIRPAPPVLVEPEQSIALWSIRELKFGYSEEKTRHLVGFVPTKKTLRVTSPIATFDMSALKVTTSSGRLYNLLGHPNSNFYFEYTFMFWMQNNNVAVAVDVTHKYWSVH